MAASQQSIDSLRRQLDASTPFVRKSGCIGSCPRYSPSPTAAAIGTALGDWLLLLFLLPLVDNVGPSAFLSFRKSYWNWTCCHLGYNGLLRGDEIFSRITDKDVCKCLAQPTSPVKTAEKRSGFTQQIFDCLGPSAYKYLRTWFDLHDGTSGSCRYRRRPEEKTRRRSPWSKKRCSLSEHPLSWFRAMVVETHLVR